MERAWVAWGIPTGMGRAWGGGLGAMATLCPSCCSGPALLGRRLVVVSGVVCAGMVRMHPLVSLWGLLGCRCACCIHPAAGVHGLQGAMAHLILAVAPAIMPFLLDGWGVFVWGVL
eukprot:8493545-Lingulodinium_polyedra.AAC.1